MDENITKNRDNNLLYKEEIYLIQGAIFSVYKEMGCGFLESVYHECLMREFMARYISFESEKQLLIHYKGQQLEHKFRADFVCYEKIIVEIKAVQSLSNGHMKQLNNYLQATGLRLGLLVNFSSYPKVTIKRIIN